jgi:hypothetical protein
MNKYKTIDGKIRHAHGPVGEALDFYGNPDAACTGCGYHVCSCPPKPKRRGWVYARELDMLVYDYLDDTCEDDSE